MNTYKKHWACTVCIATLVLVIGGTPALAQAQLDEIVVTATKRATNLQDVPLAVAAISAEMLEERNITNTSDLMGTMPNFQVTSAYGETQPNFAIRGISVANEFNASTASPIGVYVDEVYQSFRASHGQQLYDLERVEVLRGPQGTLYGRNTTGGAVNFITRAPSLDGDNGAFTFGFSRYNTVKAQGAVEKTLADGKFGVRMAGTISTGGGYIYNPIDGKDYATTDNKAGRISFRYQPTDQLDVKLKLYGARSNPRQLAYGYGYLGGETNAFGYSRNHLGENEIESDSSGRYYTRSEGASLSVNYDLSDAVSLTSITGYDEGHYINSPFDCDGSPLAGCTLRYNSKSYNFNQDFRLNYTGDRLKAIGGVTYGKDIIKTHNQPDFFGALRQPLLNAGLPGGFNNAAIAVGNSLRILPAFALNPALTPADAGFCDPVVVNPNGFFDARMLVAFQADIAINGAAGPGPVQAACAAAGALPFGPILGEQYYDIARPSYAIYGEVEYELTDKLGLTIGLRYTKEDSDLLNARTYIYDLAGTTPVANLIPYSQAYDPNLPGLEILNDEKKLTGRIILDYKFTDDIMGYASFNRGFRSGTYNALAYQDVSQLYYVQPEEVDAYEAGLKMRLFDNSVQLNLAGFYYDYTNQQLQQVVGLTSFLRNADGELYGAEAELSWQIRENLRLDAGLGLLHTEYKGNVVDPTDPSSLTSSIEGNPFTNAPEISGNVGFSWTTYEEGDKKLTLSGEAQYQGKYYFDPFKDYGQDPCDQPVAGSTVLLASAGISCGNPAYVLFNARASFDLNEKINMSVWAKNITDKNYNVYGLNINGVAVDYFFRGMPRTYGAQLTYKFE